VKFVMKRKGQMGTKTAETAAAPENKDTAKERESTSESDGESSDENVASSDDEQETGLQRILPSSGASKVAINNEDEEDDDLLIKKTTKTNKHLQLEAKDATVVEPLKSQVCCGYCCSDAVTSLLIEMG